ncbi:hypothetical protein B0T24DRAFT_707003 [Lasiosphaeria ovina]|uniref:Uncharacterized protein n=1 Tax=Lasiosphaeria ovina TaxID=92902 RepID=A0AAE0K3C6_9PEZI|nr:hypothetical protein B0T24DRAFT_707003 [Lasiosphaeria ovina]
MGPAVEECKTTLDNYRARLDRKAFYNLSASIQDTISDKEKDRMASYYQHSVFTIAAECRSPQDGLLAGPPERPFKKLKGYIYVHRHPWRSDVSYLAEADCNELMSRGWVYFECRTRPPASICNDVVGLICRKLIENEEDDNNGESSVPFRVGFKSRFFSVSADKRQAWYDPITIYSRMKLSYPAKDHLAAVPRIAAEFSNVAIVSKKEKEVKNPSASNMVNTVNTATTNPLQYLAGLWLADMHHGLLWHATDTAAARPCSCGAPSWSWALVGGDGGVNRFGQHSLAVKENCGIISAKGSILKVKGSSCPSSSPVASEPTDEPGTAGGWGVFERADLLHESPATDRENTLTLTLALAIATRKNYGGVPALFAYDVLDVLFVEPVAGFGAAGRFRRVGVGSVFEKATLHVFNMAKVMEIKLV